MGEITIIIFFLIVVGIPVTLGIGYAAFERWLKHKEKMAQALAAKTAEKAAQLPPILSGWSKGCGFSNGLPPTRVSRFPTKSSSCAMRR